MTLSVRRAAEESPDAVALVSAASSLTFAQLAARVEAVMPRLLRAGLGGETEMRAVLTVRPTMDALAPLYALFELGAPAVLLAPGLSAAERRVRVDLVRPSVNVDELPTATSQAGFAPAPAPPDDRRPLAVVFTSGTSGAPKAAVLSRAAFIASAAASEANLGWRGNDRWLLCLPPFHVGGLSILTRCLLARRPVVVAERSDPDALAGAIDSLKVTLVSLVPTQLHRLLARRPPWRPPAQLRAVLLGGAPAPSALLEEAARRGAPVLSTYGLTETCSQVATQLPGDSPLTPLTPLPGVQVRIVEGRIQVRGPTLMNGYLAAGPESPFTADGWFDTGDRGCADADGRLTVLGRADDMIISGGENVDPREVELVLEQLPAVAHALVFGEPDDMWGQSVAAVLVLRAGAALSAPNLVEFAASRLTPRKRPRKFAVVQRLPLTPAGKLDRRRASGEFRGELRPLPCSGRGPGDRAQ